MYPTGSWATGFGPLGGFSGLAERVRFQEKKTYNIERPFVKNAKNSSRRFRSKWAYVELCKV